MSAPPPANPPAMPTVVSRLPKFGSRPKCASASDGAQLSPSAAGTSTRLTNGFYHHPGPAGVNNSATAPIKQNGFIRVPTSFSVKWRKENETKEDGGTDGGWKRGKAYNVGQNRSGTNIPLCNSQQSSPGASQRDGKKQTASSTGKGRGLAQTATSSSSPSPQSSPRTLPVSKPGQSGLNNGTKQTANGLFGSKPCSGNISSLRQPQGFAFSGISRPGSGSGFRSGCPLQKKPPASRSQSTDSLGATASIQLTESDRFRSRSLTQVRQQPSPTLTSSSSSSSSSQAVNRSYSNNRPHEKVHKESTASSAQAPPRGTLAKSPVSSRTPDGAGKGRGVKVKGLGSSGLSLTSLLPPSALKKPLLPSLSPASRPSGISYKLSRPSLIKQSRPLRVTPANGCEGDQAESQRRPGWRNPVETPSTTEPSPDSPPDAPETEGLTAELLSHADMSVVGETLEDMSLSSTSSLDRNDTSQEYMDDFDNLGNGGVGILLLSSKNDEDDSGLDQSCARFDDDKSSVNGVTRTNGLCFVEDGVDWAGMKINGERGAHRLTRLSHQRRSSQPDYHDQGGSSLDLSPSDSCGSGGTYMWDEEGLEPLGGAATSASINTNSNTTHHIGSFDSDINSIDILNNLDSCDLEDDDLMLDADLAEDGSLHSDGGGLSHMAQWRRRQLCWGMQDVHNDTDSDFQSYKLTEDPGNKRTAKDQDVILDLYPPRSPCPSLGLGLDVEELAEDCCAVRSQLEFLQRLLLQEEDVEEDTLTTDTVSPDANSSSHSSDSQVQALLQEVQQLREELRSRDRTIAQLTLKLTVPTTTTSCCCQETTGRMDQYTQTSVTEKESVASQTPWSDHSSQVLHSSSQEDQEPLMDQVLPVLAPAKPCSTQPEIPGTSTTRPTTQREEDGRRQPNGEEKGGASTRTLPLPQPSRLHLFLSPTSRPACSGAAIPSKTRASKPLSNDPNGTGTSGLKLKSLGFTSSFSRLPKPKSS